MSMASDAPIPRAGPFPPDGAPTVLVVDDEPRNRALLRAWLGATHHVIEATDGESALQLVESGEVDVVLLDVMMPGRNGFETCAAIKARGDRPFLPVVVLTALRDQESRNRGLAVGADEFVSKPIDRTELMLRVAGLLRLRRQESEILCKN
jgi:two-component system cell cycle response regulator